MSGIYYKGFIIYERDNGWWAVYVGDRFMMFDSLQHAKYEIDYWTK